MVKNESGLRPLGRAVLVKPYDLEVKTESRIVIPDTAKDRARMVEQRAIVVEVGPMAWDDEVNGEGFKVPRAKPGDKVFITQFAGMLVKGVKDGKDYRLVNDRDIYCGIEEGEDNE